MKKILLVVGTANDIFIYNFAKWLKASMTDIQIDVFEFSHSDKQTLGNEYYHEVSTIQDNFLLHIPKFRVLVSDYIKSQSLKIFLRDKHYDIIQCHWILPSVVYSIKNLRKHTDKLYFTFWGGELKVQKLFASHKCYMDRLGMSLEYVDGIIGSKPVSKKINKYFNVPKSKFFYGALGSSALDSLYDIIDSEKDNNLNSCKLKSKEETGLDKNKYSVLIGYSGKSLHQHSAIIDAFVKYKQELKNQMSSCTNDEIVAKKKILDSIQLFAPMTRGASISYIKEVDEKLYNSGFSYLVLKDRFLTDEEMAHLRIATDVVLQLSTFDGYSRSIQECLCAKSLVIYGSWLGYENRFNEDGFIAYEVPSIAKGIEKTIDCLLKKDSYVNILEKNSENGRNKNLWSECIKDWVKVYEM